MDTWVTGMLTASAIAVMFSNLGVLRGKVRFTVFSLLMAGLVTLLVLKVYSVVMQGV